jgi:protein involved in polysaccharide export with SLBB domain
MFSLFPRMHSVVLVAAFLLAAVPASAQWMQVSDARGLHATRAELQHMLAVHESGEAGAVGREEAALIRNRLDEGDFQIGDQIVLVVETHPEFSETYTVEPTLEIVLTGIGGVPLRGVLRSELNEHLTQHLSRYVRNPIVRAQSSIRLMVVGGVGRPGFYSVPSHSLITDVIAAAGGTDRQSRLDRMRVERQGRPVVAGRQLENAIISGRTLDQLNIRAGDRIVVPERHGFEKTREYLWFGSALLSTVVTVVYLFRR